MNRTDLRLVAASSGGRGRRRRVRVRPHAGRRLRADGRRRCVRRLQGARLRVPVRRQRLVEHGRALERRGVRRVRRVAPESRRSPKDSLLPLSSRYRTRAAGRSGCIPRCRGSRTLFDAGRAAFVANVGPLHRAHHARAVPEPLRSAAAATVLAQRQQDQWHSLKGNVAAEVGLGRPDRRRAEQPRVASQQLALNVSLSGQTLFQAGATSVPYTMGARGPDAVRGVPAHRRRLRSPPGVPSARRRELRDRLRARVRRRAPARPAVRRRGVRCARDRAAARVAAGQSFARAIRLADAAANGREADRRARPAADVAADLLRRDRRLRHARRSGRGPAGAARYGERRASQRVRRRRCSSSVSPTRSRVHAIGLRAHAHLERRRHGSRVGRRATRDRRRRGGRPHLRRVPVAAHRRAPRRGPADDVGGGRFIPTLSSDQYAATLASWFGVAEADLPTIAPSIDNFAARNLGFLI